ncbi:MAG: transcriptional repressor [Alphaproteobacteria bacterium]|nr:transcriptional repressor [Alphaproteobacteria bacterium]
MDVHEVERLLRARRCSLTPQRRAILRYLADNDTHPTAADIFEAVTADFPITSRATVYNTIALLRELGVLSEVNLPGTEARFDPNTAPHHHLRCVRCGQLTDIPTDRVRLEHDLPGEVRSASVLFEGVCEGC